MGGTDTVLFPLQGCLFVLRFYDPVNPMGSCRARSVYLTGQTWSSKRLTSIVHILSPEIQFKYLLGSYRAETAYAHDVRTDT